MNKKKVIAIMAVILFFGSFLRIYHFSDWLRFNSDQARDAVVVRNMIEKNKIPLLGPVAGGSQFRVGPVFYYFQFASAKLFGASPDKMAYPDLLWGILAVPLVYFFLREFFRKSVSLLLGGLYAVSSFTVGYSRFAWNPNSSQFFCLLFLFSLLKILNAKGRSQFIWIIISGFSLGVAVQLHTLLIFGLPLFFLIVSVISIKNKSLSFGKIFGILALAVFLNIPQIISEIKSNGENFKQFELALVDKSKRQSPIWKNTLHIISCQIYANANILVSRDDQESCADPFADKYFKRLDKKIESSGWILYFIKFSLACIFSFGGYFFLFQCFRKEKIKGRRNFLTITLLYNAALAVVFIPFGAEISLRYFIFLAFIPFVFLGLWFESAKSIIKKYSFALNFFAFFLIGILASYNIFFNFKTFQNQSRNIPGNMIDGTMNQAKKMSDYLVTESNSNAKIQIGGQDVYLGRFINRISYFMSDLKIDVIPLNKKTEIDRGVPVFMAVNEMSEECRKGISYKYGEAEKCQKFFDVTLIKIKK